MNVENDRDFNAKLEILIPEETHTAGKPNVTRVIIRNPYDFPIEIINIQAPRSSQISRLVEARAEVSDSSRNESLGRISSIIRGFLFPSFITEVTFGGVRAEFPGNQHDLHIKAKENARITIEENIKNFDNVYVIANESAEVQLSSKENPSSDNNEDKPIVVHPRCEKVAYFTTITRSWLFFTPQRTNLSTEVRYIVNGQERSQVVTSYYDIKPPLSSMVIGAVVGGGLGAAARILQNQIGASIQEIAVQGGAAIIMSLIAAIALSRKTGTQGFITVEDFFGSFVIGALIGYGGSEYFERAVLPGGDGREG